MYLSFFLLLTIARSAISQPAKCDQTPPHATVPIPSEDRGNFHLAVENAETKDDKIRYTPDQTYVLSLTAENSTKPFRWFMITAEDPDVDNSIYKYRQKSADVGSLKTLDSGQSTYSERCANSVENYDNMDKTRIEIHWVSPKMTEKVRIRAMVAENNEVWYIGENLTLVLEMDNRPSSDSPPLLARDVCNLCSEARYELIFKGQWSRLTHPRHYPSKPDENGYSHMVGASHDFNFTLWKPNSKATPGLQLLAEEANSTDLEREIINAMSIRGGTRTLIRGKRRHHPNMMQPSHSLFRVDPIHHLFSVAIALKPSPDWFLGTTHFELCTKDGWFEEHNLPLYPWDAGTMDGVSYESQKSMTQPRTNIERVEVGSFDQASPFYQMNLRDLKPFAWLEVKRLDVYEWDPSECPNAGEEEPQDEPLLLQPLLAESKQRPSCAVSEWAEWSPCVPDVGACGIGAQTRTRRGHIQGDADDIYVMSDRSSIKSCEETDNQATSELRNCYVEC